MQIQRLLLPLSMLLLLSIGLQTGCAQAPADRPPIANKAFDKKVSGLLSFSVPTIGVDKLKGIKDEVFLFDTRKLEEYQVSHIEGARYLGYEDFDPARLGELPKDAPIVVYCSIGYRSEKIGEQLKEMGYTNVYNLYGSIFEWVNAGNAVVDDEGKPTKSVHTYNRKWSKWLENKGEVNKVW